jgi:hypothetical protein
MSTHVSPRLRVLLTSSPVYGIKGKRSKMRGTRLELMSDIVKEVCFLRRSWCWVWMGASTTEILRASNTFYTIYPGVRRSESLIVYWRASEWLRRAVSKLLNWELIKPELEYWTPLRLKYYVFMQLHVVKVEITNRTFTTSLTPSPYENTRVCASEIGRGTSRDFLVKLYDILFVSFMLMIASAKNYHLFFNVLPSRVIFIICHDAQLEWDIVDSVH